MLLILVACAVLGFFSFLDLFEGSWGKVVSEDIHLTLGVTAYLFAIGLICQQSGLIVASVVTLLGWLTNDVVRKTPELARWQWSAAPMSAPVLLIYVCIYVA